MITSPRIASGGLAAAALLLASTASADTVDAVFTGTGAGQNVSIAFNGGGYGNVFAGQLKYALSNSSGPTWLLNGNWTTFCTEFNQYTSGSSQVYTIMDVADLPTPGAGMGQAKADLVAKLYAFAGGTQYTNNANLASAFQIAIWEIVYDFDGSTLASLDITDGALKANVNGTIGGLVGSLLTGAFGSASMADLIGMGNLSHQDQIIDITGIIPGPGSLALLGLGAVLAPRRRRA